MGMNGIVHVLQNLSIRALNIYDSKLVSCWPAGLIPHLKFSPASPPSGKPLVPGCKPALEGGARVGCSVVRTFCRGICLIAAVISKRDDVKTENIFTEGLVK